MSVFIVSTVIINDAEKFALYSQAIAGLSARYGGQYIVKGAASEMLEGELDTRERVVVARFPDKSSLNAYVTDPVYIAAKALRLGAADVQMRVLEE